MESRESLEKQRTYLIHQKNIIFKDLEDKKNLLKEMESKRDSNFLSIFSRNNSENITELQKDIYTLEAQLDIQDYEIEGIIYELDKLSGEENPYSEHVSFHGDSSRVIEKTEYEINMDAYMHIYELVREILGKTDIIEYELKDIDSWSFFDVMGFGQVSDLKRKNSVKYARETADLIKELLKQLEQDLKESYFENKDEYRKFKNYIRFGNYFMLGEYADVTEKHTIQHTIMELGKTRSGLYSVKNYFEEKAENTRMRKIYIEKGINNFR